MFRIPPEVAKEIGTFPELPVSEYEATRARWGNAISGSLDGPDCPICQNRGYTVKVDEKGNLANVECSCMARRRSLKRIERSGLKELLSAYTFDAFQTGEPWQAAMKNKARSFLSDATGKWFAAMGSIGSGKTHICTAICGELLNTGSDVRYVRWRNEGAKLKALVNNRDEYERMIEPLKTVKVLYIDDLFKTQTGKEITQGDINLAFELLDYRYGNRHLVTIISSEKTIEEILSIDEAVGSRIFERCKDYYLCLTGNKNQRLR